MHRTIFDTPVVRPLMSAAAQLALRLSGWRVEGRLPERAQRCVLIAAPHTSNWDLPFTLMAAFTLRLRVYWLGKVQIFRPPFGGVMRWLGGIAVRRDAHHNLVAATAEALRGVDGPVQLVVPPEGTRSRTAEWKTGFYWIAHGAGVPIVLAYIDYVDKRVGLGPVFEPTGDVERDIAAIKAWYAPFRGKRRDQFDVS